MRSCGNINNVVVRISTLEASFKNARLVSNSRKLAKIHMVRLDNELAIAQAHKILVFIALANYRSHTLCIKDGVVLVPML